LNANKRGAWSHLAEANLQKGKKELTRFFSYSRLGKKLKDGLVCHKYDM
jgi:hypothetical protein